MTRLTLIASLEALLPVTATLETRDMLNMNWGCVCGTIQSVTLRLKEVELSQGHTTDKCWRWDSA